MTSHFNRMFAKNLASSQEEAAFATLLANYTGYKRALSPTATPTLTQSGLLAVLLERQRYKMIQLARRRARHEKMRDAFWRARTWLFHALAAQRLANNSAKPVIGTIPHHT
jgi:hypothetical protein